LEYEFLLFYHLATFEQATSEHLINNGHKFGVPRVVVVRKFDCNCAI